MARGRNYDKQVKAEAVSLVIDNGKSIASVSRELEIPKKYDQQMD
ncbi:transposase [Corticicoccus populi]|uniref:Transposase n=1 Tax=Corticicoccus populi TaxID=1812821 RepID=A0ABW5WZD3_9STAP